MGAFANKPGQVRLFVNHYSMVARNDIAFKISLSSILVKERRVVRQPAEKCVFLYGQPCNSGAETP